MLLKQETKNSLCSSVVRAPCFKVRLGGLGGKEIQRDTRHRKAERSFEERKDYFRWQVMEGSMKR
jgi:hypothetical protein